MARSDDYQAARKIAVQQLKSRPFSDILQATGFEAVGGDAFRVPFLGRVYQIGFPEFSPEAGIGILVSDQGLIQVVCARRNPAYK